MVDRHFRLSTLTPTLGQRQRAGVLALLMICGCVLTLPFAGTRVPRFDALILVGDSALAVLVLMSAVLLFAQFRVTRAPALLALGCGFLLLSLTTVSQLACALRGAFPDLRMQLLADAALPLAAIGYALLGREAQAAVEPGSNGGALTRFVVAVLVTAVLITWLTRGNDDLNPGLQAQPLAWRVLASCFLLAAPGLAIGLLWRRRTSLLDLWLLVTLTAWLMYSLLRAVSVEETSLTWQAAPLYELSGATCMLLALLSENATLHARLAGLLAARRGRDGAPIDPVIEAVRQPLCAITANADAAARLLDHEPPDLVEVRAALEDIVDDAQRTDRLLLGVRGPSVAADATSTDVDVAQLVDECLRGMRGALHAQRVTCEVRTAEQLPGVRGIRLHLLQLVSNLLSHALEAMSSELPASRRLCVHATRHDARTVVICVEPDGGGAAFKVILPASQ